MEGEDEREGLGSFGELGLNNRPKLHNIEGGMEMEASPHAAAQVHRVQSGAIVSREKTSLLGDQLTDICQNVNSFIGHLDEQNLRHSHPNVDRGFGLNNVALSDNSISDVNNQCNNDINFNRNSVQERTHYLSNSQQGIDSSFNNSVSQRRHMSSGCVLDQTIAPFHSVSPSVSGEGINKDYNAQRPNKWDSDPESTNKISNKRRLLGGVSIGAPAPKIKRKRQNVPEPKQQQQVRQMLAPSTLSPPTSTFSPPTPNEPKPSAVDLQATSKSSPESIMAFPREEASQMDVEPSSKSENWDQKALQDKKEISHVPENNFEDNISTNLNTELNMQANANENLLNSKPVLFTPSADESDLKREDLKREDLKRDADSSLLINLNEESEEKDSDHCALKQVNQVEEVSKTDNQEALNNAESICSEFASPEKPNDSFASDKDPQNQDDPCSLLQTLAPQVEESESLSDPQSTNENCEPLGQKSPLPKENMEIKGDPLTPETDKPKTESEISTNESDEQKVSPEHDASVNEDFTKGLYLENPSSTSNRRNVEAEDEELGQMDAVDRSKGAAHMMVHEEGEPNVDTNNSPQAKEADPLNHLEQSIESEGISSSKEDASISLQEELGVTPDENAALPPREQQPQEEDQGVRKGVEEYGKEKEGKPKLRERFSRDGKGSSDEEEANSDGELKKRHMRRRAGASGLSAKPKVKNLRRNIREIISDDKLEENTLVAQKEEQLRLQRLQEKRLALREYMEQQQVERLVAEVAEAAEAVTAAEAVEEVEAAEMAAAAAAEKEEAEELDMEVKARSDDSDIVVLSSEEEDEPKVKEEESEAESSEEEPLLKPKIEIKSENEESMDDSDQKSKSSEESDSESDSDVVVLSHSEDEEDTEDVNNSGAHINDQFNVTDAQGRVLVNVGHPEKEEDIFLATQLSHAVKPHQIGGIRFLYDNIVESIEQFKTSNGFGCILAHSMGLGKTLQVVSFTDIFLRHTDAKTVLIIVPINTLQNWQAEYNQWLPEDRPPGVPEDVEIRFRTFKVFILNDAQKNLQARFKVITQWYQEGGVLLMGYELYRQLSLKKPKKPKKKKKKKDQIDSEIVDIEEEDKNKELLDGKKTLKNTRKPRS